MPHQPTPAIVVMGPAGAGKTTVGSRLAEALGWRFVEADAFHSPANVDKMRRGIGLSDADRHRWLEAVRQVMTHAAASGEPLVVACSALKRQYREVLAASGADVRFVHLDADPALLRERLASRLGHFAGPDLLDSQTRDLEPPGDEALTLDASQSPEDLVDAIRAAWRL